VGTKETLMAHLMLFTVHRHKTVTERDSQEVLNVGHLCIVVRIYLEDVSDECRAGNHEYFPIEDIKCTKYALVGGVVDILEHSLAVLQRVQCNARP